MPYFLNVWTSVSAYRASDFLFIQVGSLMDPGFEAPRLRKEKRRRKKTQDILIEWHESYKKNKYSVM